MNEEITVKEVIEKRTELEQLIFNAISIFENTISMKVEFINVFRQEIMSGDSQITDIKIDLKFNRRGNL